MPIDEELPEEFDAVILGTGLCESIVAAALSRVGLSVLHLDHNTYYGSLEATFSLRGLLDYPKTQSGEVSSSLDASSSVLCDSKQSELSNLEYVSYELSADEQSLSETGLESNTLECQSASSGCLSDKESSSTVEDGSSHEMNRTSVNKLESSQTVIGDNISEGHTDVNDMNNQCEITEPLNQDKRVQSVDPVVKEFLEKRIEQAGLELRLTALLRRSNKFILDLSPKLMYSCSDTVDLLVTSDIARYLEFKTVTQIATVKDDSSLEIVPCSRADIFSSKLLTMIEKRLLMKFLTTCLDYKRNQEQYQEFANRPFREFLQSQKLNENLISYVTNSIAMVSDSTLTFQGLEKTEKFLRSVGRYGPSPFLWPLYGGEINQAFCRASAVFGGIYILNRTLSNVHIENQENRVQSVTCNQGKTFKCKWLVLNPAYVQPTFRCCPQMISRAIIITSRSLIPASIKDETVLVSVPASEKSRDPIRLVELGPSTYSCPNEPTTRVVHMTTSSSELSARQDLEPYVKKLFSTDSSSEKPRVYFCAYFNMPNFGDEPNIPNQPHNMFIASGPDESISPDNSVIQARKIFMTICPGEEFLPRPPDPEDIIYCDDESRKSKSSTEDFSTENEAGGTQEAILEQHSPNKGDTSSEKTKELIVPT